MQHTFLGAIICTLVSTHIYAEEETYLTTRVLTVALASQVAVTAEQTCKAKGYQVAVAVVDRYGNLLAFSRDPLAGAHTIVVAQDKAYTAATFQAATLELGESMSFLRNTPRITLTGGGVPVRIAGYMYGAVGVSGAPRDKVPGDVDDMCARAGIDSIKDALEFDG